MKISSRSLLSPGRAGPGSARDPPPISLSTSLSRRLRNSRSVKGGASPAMFLVTGKKRGGFENPEPSSPKVTCIGQVRVKSKKKHAKNVRSLSRRRSTGEVGLRKLEHSRDGFGSQSQHLGSNYQLQNQECLSGQRNNQKWVHLPLTICEALRTFGSDVSCLFPCRSSCSSTTMEKEEKMVAGGSVEGGSRQGSCGAMFARWLLALQEGDGGGRDACGGGGGSGGGGGGGGTEIEIVAGDDEDESEEMDVRNSRRHVFQYLEIVNDSILGTNDEARVSICVPPKNALLLMRSRSDPAKMEALTNRFWDPPVEKIEEENEGFAYVQEKEISQEDLQLQKEEKLMDFVQSNDQEHDDLQEDAVDQEVVETNFELETKQSVQEEIVEMNSEMETKQSGQEDDDQEQSININEEVEEESMFLWSLFEENEEEDAEEEACSDMKDGEELFKDIQETETGESNTEKLKDFEENNEEMVKDFTEISEETTDETHEEFMESTKMENGVLERENEERDSNSKRLPECLLLMMYEPKLSMEVSKETWVCSSDFIRRRSGRKKPPPPIPVNTVNCQGESKANASSTSCVTTNDHDNTAAVQFQPIIRQPARSSCSFPAPPMMAAMLEQKLANTMGFEPLVLTRCKSEPMRTKVAPEPCFWKNKLEPPRRASFHIGLF